MIREDIKNYINSSGIIPDMLFKEHRVIDQSNYRVGLINNEIIVWNPETNMYMDYFYDDLMSQEWFCLSLLDNELENYFIHRDGRVKGPRKDLRTQYDLWGYPNYKIHGSHKKIHTLLAKLFIPNIDPENNTVVDHKDRNKNNYQFNNLRWFSIKNNCNNIYRPKWTGDNIYKAYTDINLTKLEFELTDEEFFNRYIKSPQISKSYVRSSEKNHHKFDNYYWKVEDRQLTDYLKTICNTEDINETEWVLHYSNKFYVHPLGLIREVNSVKPTVGCLACDKLGNHKERRFSRRRVHDLIAEVFLNNNSKLSKDLVIDHINTNSLDNRVLNLKICTQKENMNNSITKNKLSRKVKNKDGIIFNSIKDCAAHYNVSEQAIWSKLNGRRPSHGLTYVENDQST